MAAGKTDRASRRASLVVEIGTEELPPRDLRQLGRAFAGRIKEGLAAAGVVDEARANCRYFATPRRLAALVHEVAARPPSRVVERRGPSLQAAYDALGKPSRAALGFAKSCGVEVAQLATLKTDKGAWLVYRRRVAGASLAAIVSACLEDSARRLPVAKRMRWGDHPDEFVRPAHWLLAVHGGRVVGAEVLGLKADRLTRGHRFHADRPLAVAHADDYPGLLESDGRVIADFERRRRVIAGQLKRLAKSAGGCVPEDAELLDLVTGLVEWPRALAGRFDRRFLKIPPEVLVACMRDHQKFFPLVDARGKLLPDFIAVSNIAGRVGARVRRGNERVLRARLADAEFFWMSDRKTPLESRLEALKGVRFHNRLGTLYDKTQRVSHFAAQIAGQHHVNADIGEVRRAARLCKADLVTDLVGEFPALQGVIGRYYARQCGENQRVADAIEQHYWPRHAGDQLPHHAVGQCVALAERIDSLIGLFACGDIPGGDKDPFALRRAALGVLRILIEKQLDLDVHELLTMCGQCCYARLAGAEVKPDAQTVERVFEFILERLKAYYQPMGYSALELASVMACKPRRPLDFDRRLKALSGFFKTRPQAAEALAAANKRIAGILNRADAAPPRYEASLFRHPAETELARQLDAIGARAGECFSANRYDAGLVALSALKRPIDEFFDQVMVMERDTALRHNRLALLGRIRRLFLGVADFSLMQAEP